MSNIFDEQSLSFLAEYLNTASPVGFEQNGQKVWIDYLKPYVDEMRTDNYGSAYGIINPDAPYKVVIEAHADEISWYVNYITDDGFIYVIQNGASDHIIAPSKKVNIHTKDGIVEGLFGWPAIHLRDPSDETPTVDKIWIDCGCTTKEEVLELGIDIGSVVTYPDEFFTLNNRYFVCRAIDNRMGGFMIAEIARKLFENKDQLDFGLYIVNAVQEEVGLRGAEMITETIKPDVVIVTDVTHDTSTPLILKNKSGDKACGKGPVIYYAPAIQNNLRELILSTAVSNNIPFQRAAASRATGTDTDAFAYSNGGVPSALISLAMRYMHTTVEMVHQSDVKNVIELIYQSLKNIKGGQNFKYHQF